MPVSITLETLPIGSQFTSTIDSGETDDKNDFRVRILLDGNGTGLTLSNLSVSDGSIASLDGSNAVWEAVVRPPETAVDALTFTVAADTFSEGNTETTKDIRVSTTFPDDDAQAPTSLFSVTSPSENAPYVTGIAVSPTRVLVSASIGNTNHTRRLLFYTHSGVAQTSENAEMPAGRIDFFNGDLLWSSTSNEADQARRYALDGILTQNLSFLGFPEIAPTRLGILASSRTNRSNSVQIRAYEDGSITQIDPVGYPYRCDHTPKRSALFIGCRHGREFCTL